MNDDKIDTCFEKNPVHASTSEEIKKSHQKSVDVDVKALKTVLKNIFVLETYEIKELVQYIREYVMDVDSACAHKESKDMVKNAPGTLKQLCRELHQLLIDSAMKDDKSHDDWVRGVLHSISDVMEEMLNAIDFETDLKEKYPFDMTVEDSANCWFGGSYDSMKAAAHAAAAEKKKKRHDNKRRKVEKQDTKNKQGTKSQPKDKTEEEGIQDECGNGMHRESSSSDSEEDYNAPGRKILRDHKLELTRKRVSKQESTRHVLCDLTQDTGK